MERRQRRSFILLEVFIAISLLTMAIIPISSYPYKVFEKEKKELLAIELKRAESLVFARFVQGLCEHITPHLLEQGLIELELEKQWINLEKLGHFPYRAKISITSENKKKSSYLLACEVSLIPEGNKGFTPQPCVHYLLITTI